MKETLSQRADALRIRLIRMRDQNKPTIVHLVLQPDEYDKRVEKHRSASELLNQAVNLQFRIQARG